MKITFDKLKEGDIFSEHSTFRFNKKVGNSGYFTHLESNEEISIEKSYCESYLLSADQYTEEIIVGVENKYWTQKQIDTLIKEGKFKNELEIPKTGDLKQLGIKAIWDSVHYGEVFTVKYKKVDKVLSEKKVNELREKQISEALSKLELIKNSKKGVFEASKKILKDIQDNPVLTVEEGAERVLVGKKKQMKSIDSFYDVYDLKIEGEENVRKVNINTISEIIYKNCKFILEK